MNLGGSPQLHLVLSWEMLRLGCGAVSRILLRCNKMATGVGSNAQAIRGLLSEDTCSCCGEISNYYRELGSSLALSVYATEP